MKNNLIIFIDALPYRYLSKTKFMNSFPIKKYSTPGIGYSINLHVELFAGLRPDEVGFFNKWNLDPQNSPVKALRPLTPLLKLLGKNRDLDLLVRKWIKKKYGGIVSIPLHLAPWFGKRGKDVKDPKFPTETIFKKLHDVAVIDPGSFEGLDRDAAVYYATRDAIDNHENVYGCFMGLDGIGHDYGSQSPQFIERIKQLDIWVEDLSVKFKKKFPQGNVIVLSDHGMADIEKVVSIDFDSIMKKVGCTHFTYFVDSVMARIWCFSENEKNMLKNELNELGLGTLLSEEERIQYGVASRDYGDFIYILNEGLLFYPDFFVGVYRDRNETVKAMHGYHPRNESQRGLFLYDGEYKNEADFLDGTPTVEIYQKLIDICL